MAYIFITRKEKTNWKYILIIVILALIVAGETLYLARQEVKIPEIKLPQKPKEETANWKTYRNEEYGFEIKYPEDWQAGGLFGREESGVVFEKYFEKSTTVHSKCMLSINYIPYEIFKKYFNSPNSYVGRVPATKVVNVGSYYYFKYRDHYFEIFHLILVSKYIDGHWIDVGNTINPETNFLCEKIFNQMLSTFRFLE